MTDTVSAGYISEFKVKTKLLELGFTVLEPLTNSLPYDLLVESNNRFYRIQVKTGRIKNNVVLFDTCGTACNMIKTSKKYYQGKIDFFAVYCPENTGYYLIPIEQATRSTMNLRLFPAKNNNTKLIKWAKDYLFDTGIWKWLA